VANRFLHIGINFKTPNDIIRINTLAGAMDVIAPDWLRYTPTNWLVYTDKTAQQMTDALRPFLQNDEYLILPIDITGDRQGWMTKMVWDWLSKPRLAGWTPPAPYIPSSWSPAPTPPPLPPGPLPPRRGLKPF